MNFTHHSSLNSATPLTTEFDPGVRASVSSPFDFTRPRRRGESSESTGNFPASRQDLGMVELRGTAFPATTVGVLSETRSYTDAISSGESQDYYHFYLNAVGPLNLALTQLTADLDLFVYYDRNSNGQIDTDEELGRSVRSGPQDESLNLQLLSAGSYFAKVVATGVSTSGYTLSLSNRAPSDLLPVELDWGKLVGSRTQRLYYDTTDTADVFRVEVTDASQIQINLINLTNNADVRLIQDLNNDRIITSNEVIASSVNPGVNPDSIRRSLTAGVYYVQVVNQNAASTLDFSITLTPDRANPTPLYSTRSGYGLVNAAAAVQAATQSLPFNPVADLGGNSWNLDLINAPEVWAQGFTGQNVVVAVVDSGVNWSHPDLDGNIWVNTREIANNGIDDDGNGFIDDIRGWDFVDRDRDPMDFDGHGTHVAGIIAAENNAFGVTGVAYNAKIMPVRVLNEIGQGTLTNVANGIRYAVDNGANIINLSLGGSYSSEIEAAIAYATQRNILVVMAAGNEAQSEPVNPAALATRYGIAVGAVDRNQQIPRFSNSAGQQEKAYVLAPGVSITSTVLGEAYENFNGTSMAAPHVAGVAALMLSANPQLTVNQITQILTNTTRPNGVAV
jgi:subtilisin family serine protease